MEPRTTGSGEILSQWRDPAEPRPGLQASHTQGRTAWRIGYEKDSVLAAHGVCVCVCGGVRVCVLCWPAWRAGTGSGPIAVPSPGELCSQACPASGAPRAPSGERAAAFRAELPAEHRAPGRGPAAPAQQRLRSSITPSVPSFPPTEAVPGWREGPAPARWGLRSQLSGAGGVTELSGCWLPTQVPPCPPGP